MGEMYPMTLPFDGLRIVVDRDGWRFENDADQLAYCGLPVLKRMELRRQFELQVQLAKNTTKGDR